MQIKKNLNIFDFDETLFRVPGFTSAEAKGREPYEWFDSPESLDKRFNIKGIANTIERTKDDAVNVLVTHRVKPTKNRVMEILSDAGIIFNEVHFLGRGSHKAETVLKLIDELDVDRVTIFEDSLWEIISYTAHFLDAGLRNSIAVDFYFVDKSKIIKIDWDTACQLEETAEVERLRIL